MPALQQVPHHRQPAPEGAPSPLVAALRDAAWSCRAAPRPDLGAACACLARGAGTRDVACALARVLPEVMERRPTIWPRRAPGLSFDEAWIDALARALGAGDEDSARFLLGRRVRPGGRAALRMLVSGLAARLSQEGLDRV